VGIQRLGRVRGVTLTCCMVAILFLAALPASAQGDSVAVGDKAGGPTDPRPDASDNYSGVLVENPDSLVRDVIFTEDFATCPGSWTITDPAGDGTWFCASALPSWTIPPEGPVADPMMLIDDDAVDGDNYDEQLISPVIDCTDYTGVTLDFDGMFNSVFTGTPYPDSDYLNVEVYDGSTWQQVGTFPTFDDDIGFGNVGPFDISAWADGNASLQVRFTFYDHVAWAWGGVIDNVVVSGTWIPVELMHIEVE